MDFHKSLFLIYFIIIIIPFTIYNLNPTFESQELTLKRTESVRFFRPVIWKNIPIEISIKNFDLFKTEIRKWKRRNCSCRFCKTFAKDLSFINISQ